MTLILEDGTGVASANSYASATYAGGYHASRGNLDGWEEVLEAGAAEGMLIDATRVVEQTYGWLGYIATSTQGLGLPREEIVLRDGRSLDGPAQVALAADAVSLLALELWRDRPPADGVRKRSESLPDYSVTYDLESERQYAEADRILSLIAASGSLGGKFSNGSVLRWS